MRIETELQFVQQTLNTLQQHLSLTKDSSASFTKERVETSLKYVNSILDSYPKGDTNEKRA